MGIRNLLKQNSVLNDEFMSEIESNISTCNKLCENADMDAELIKDENTFHTLKIDEETLLFNSSKISKIHFIVPTSKTDWAHDALIEKIGSVQWKISQWIENNKDNFKSKGDGEVIRCSVSSLPIDVMDMDVINGAKNSVIILPHFIEVQDLRAEDVDNTLNEIVPLLLNNKMDILLDMNNVKECPQDSFIFLCCHKSRDKRCGITAPILQKYFNRYLQDVNLYRDYNDNRPHGCTVAFVNHLGGHKFAANVVIYLKNHRRLIWLGRVTPTHCEEIVKSIIVPKDPVLPFPEMIRCVKKYSF